MTSPLRLFSDLGSALRLLLETVAGLKQVQVAERTGIAQNRLSRYENGRQLPDVPTLDRLLAFYGVDVERLGRALKEVRGKRIAKSSGSDPEFTAKVKVVHRRLSAATLRHKTEVGARNYRLTSARVLSEKRWYNSAISNPKRRTRLRS
jgi:transcriptional regulator with XRE-family HTH domain